MPINKYIETLYFAMLTPNVDRTYKCWNREVIIEFLLRNKPNDDFSNWLVEKIKNE